jgi:hypothetical protein
MKRILILLFILAFNSLSLSAQASFTLPASDCVNATYTLNANSGTISATSYSWNCIPAASLGSPGAATTSITFTATGNYSVTLIVTSSSGTSSVTHTISIGNQPLMINLSMSSATTCVTSNYPAFSKAVILTASGAAVYTWNPHGSGVNNGTNTVRPVSNTCYTVTGLSGACSGSALACVNVIPQFTAAVSPASGIRCLQDSLRLQVTQVSSLAHGKASTFTYYWTENLNAPPISMSSYLASSVKVFPQNNTTYTLEVRDSLSCISIPVLVPVTVQNCTGVKEHVALRLLSVSPNPFSDRLTVCSAEGEVQLTDLEILNIAGERAGEIKVTGPCTAADLRHLAPGIYLIRAKRGETSASVKVVKID